MKPYNRTIDPPAPFLGVTVSHPVSVDRRDTLFAQIDTGADLSGIPQRTVTRLGLVAARSIPIEGYDNVPTYLSTYVVAIDVAGVRFHGLEVVPLPGEHALLGRDVLNHFYAHLNGPDLTFDLTLDPPA
jgi:hypothetical protein